MAMERILGNIYKEATAVKLTPLKKACRDALDIFDDEKLFLSTPTYELRRKCLDCVQMALESRSSRFAAHGINALQKLIMDDRFHSSIESDDVELWLPLQVLHAVQATPAFTEDVQIEVMKVLLQMTLSPVWCASAKIITRIADVCLETYAASSQASIKTAIRATLTQMLSSLAEKLYQAQCGDDSDSEAEKDAEDLLSDFVSSGTSSKDNLTEDVVQILKYLCDKLHSTQIVPQNKPLIPLLLEGIYSVLRNLPTSIRDNSEFVELLWKRLCPALISMLGNPLTDKSVHQKAANQQQQQQQQSQQQQQQQQQQQEGDVSGRGSGCSSSAPNISDGSAKTVYNIAIELVKIVGCLRSLRPVLESVFYRMMLYPPPQHRLEALKLIKEVLSSPEGLLSLAGPTVDDGKSSKYSTDPSKLPQANTALLKLVVDAVQECVHCTDVLVCTTSVYCIDELLKSLEQLSNGEYLSQDTVDDIMMQFQHLDIKSPRSTPKHARAPSRVPPPQQPPELPRNPEPTGDVNDRTRDEDYDVITVEIVDESATDREETLEAEAEVNGGHDDGHVGVGMMNGDDATVHTHCDGDQSQTNAGDKQTNKTPSALHVSGDTIDDTNKDTWTAYTVTNDNQREKNDVSVTVETTTKLSSKFDIIERQSAQDYITCFLQVLPSLYDVTSGCELDETLQTFASNFCAGQQASSRNDEPSQLVPILNADGVYLTTYAVLSLNLRLTRAGFYHSKDTPIPVTESEFISDILHGELLLYLSDTWLSEVYHQVTTKDLLQTAGYNELQHRNCTLHNTLIDIDGMASRQVRGQLLREFANMADEDDINEDVMKKRAVEGGMKFSRAVLVLCWDGILDILSVLPNGKSSCGLLSSLNLMLGMEGAREDNKRAQEAMCMSLDGLQRAARLSCLLGLHMRCGAVFEQLAHASCVLEDLRHSSPAMERKSKMAGVLSQKPKLPRLHAAHALSLDVVLSTGLEMGSHARDCWSHVFRCCAHVNHLEHVYFSSGASTQPKTLKPQQTGDLSPEEDELGPELYSAGMNVPVMAVAPTINVPELIRQSRKESGWDAVGGGVLNNTQTSKALCSLSQAVDKLFEEASVKLTMKALIGFLSELCRASKQQLYMLTRIHCKDEGTSSMPTNVLHLYRLGDVMLRCIRGNRPLMHIMKAWTTVSPHLVEAACHRDQRISKKAVTCIHECITTLLSTHQELSHFHFNELLCKPFENLLCMELCDGDVQDQIVCSICELVEACTTEICSGWRPLFAALRAVKIEFTASEEVNEARQRHVAAVLDVFDVFLNSDNVLVFTNAAVDCILCLLKYVRGPGAFESDEDSDDEGETSGDTNENLCIPALNYLKQCCTILSRMWNMPSCPVFNGAHRIRLTAVPKCVDPVIPVMDLDSFRHHFTDSPVHHVVQPSAPSSEHLAELTRELNDGDILNSFSSVNLNEAEFNQATQIQQPNTVQFKEKNIGLSSSIRIQHLPKTLAEMDNHTGILHVWFLLLDGLASAVSASPKSYQPQTLEVLFDLLRSAAESPGPEFGIHCINHLLLPTLQEWMRRSTRSYGYWRGQANNFKQCMGLASDLIVEYIVKFVGSTEECVGIEFMMKQLLDVLVECISQPLEIISRLGCSCFRHVLLSGGPVLTESLWYIAVQSLIHACHVSTYSLEQIMMLFEPHSTNFSGDLGGVKVATRRDCCQTESERLHQIAHQVFLLDNQRAATMDTAKDVDTDKSYIFLLYPLEHADSINPDHIAARVPFRSIVVGLLSHQLLLQTVGAVLLQGVEHSHINNYVSNHRNGSCSDLDEDFTDRDSRLPGMMSYLSTRNLMTLLQCLQESYDVACQFDTRPGLKFLIQKVARAHVAANLYKQAGVSMTYMINTLVEIISKNPNEVHSIRTVLSQHITAMKSRDDTKSRDLVPKPFDISDNHVDVARARTSQDGAGRHNDVYVRLLFEVSCEVCGTYVDLVSDKDQTAVADRMSEHPLFFLVAQPDDLPELKREKSLVAMVTEKLKQQEQKQQQQEDVEESLNMGIVCTATLAVQGDEHDDVFVQVAAPLSEVSVTSSCSTPRTPDDTEVAKISAPEDKVYRVATDQTIKALMTEYKKRKLHHAMPSFNKSKTRSSSCSSQQADIRSVSSQQHSSRCDLHIEHEQRSSIMKDAEAHIRSWTELTCTMMDLVQQLPLDQYTLLLPILFPSINQLICHAEHPRLKRALAQWVTRLGDLSGLTVTIDKVK